MRVLVCGTRDAENYLGANGRLVASLSSLCVDEHVTALIEGGCNGPDEWARQFANLHKIPCFTYRAQWAKHGKSAGPIRNQRMIDIGKPDLVVAVWDGKSRGTRDMIERAVKAHVPVRIIPC